MVAHDSPVNVQSWKGFTPLYLAAQENHEEIVRFLLECEADQSLATYNGFTPVDIALQEGNDIVASVLVQHKHRQRQSIDTCIDQVKHMGL